jgi:hypothetical protein
MLLNSENLIRTYDRERLKKISARIIDAYKRKDGPWLADLAGRLRLDTGDGRHGVLFKKLIFLFHPDRMARFHAGIRTLAEKGDAASLEALVRLAREMPAPSSVSGMDVPEPFEPDYATGDDLFAAAGMSEDEFLDGLSVTEYEAEEYGFIEAVKNLMYGNLFSEFLPKDLLSLEGMLELPGEDIEDLKGIEYCRNITGLNLEENGIDSLAGLEELTQISVLYLARNRIHDISPLKNLSALTSLDLSFNEIEEAGELAGLGGLRYLNLIGNPLKDGEALRELAGSCIVLTD